MEDMKENKILKRKRLSECELTTMKCIWDAKKPIACGDIMTELREKYGLNYKDTTVYTFLTKLKKKGFVDSYRGKKTCYVPLCSEEDYRTEQLENDKNFWFGGSAVLMMQTLWNNDKIVSDEDKEELMKLFKANV